MYAAGGGENWAKVSKNTTTHFSVFCLVSVVHLFIVY